MLDPQVIPYVLKVLHPLGLKAALHAIEEHRQDQTALTRARTRLVQQAEDNVAEAHRRYRLADPRHARVKADLEERLEQALEQLDTLKRQIAEITPALSAVLSNEDAAELVALASRSEELWSAPTTTNEDRKRLLRTVISRVLVHEATEDTLEIEIVWVGGLVERCRVLRHGGIDELVRALWKAGKDPQAIADELRARNIKSRFGRWLTKANIEVRLRLHGLTARPQRVPRWAPETWQRRGPRSVKSTCPPLPDGSRGRRATAARRRSAIAPPRPDPIHCSAVTREWLDFLAGLLAQAAWDERTTDPREETPKRP